MKTKDCVEIKVNDKTTMIRKCATKLALEEFRAPSSEIRQAYASYEVLRERFQKQQDEATEPDLAMKAARGLKDLERFLCETGAKVFGEVQAKFHPLVVSGTPITDYTMSELADVLVQFITGQSLMEQEVKN